jgi:hypothetical protein
MHKGGLDEDVPGFLILLRARLQGGKGNHDERENPSHPE